MAKTDDLYAILGVPKTAKADEIRSAYRKLAKQSHPDLHPGDSAAEDTFKSISAAYDILGDEDKRARYDRGEIDATGAETHPGGFYKQHADAGGPRQYTSSAGYEDFADLNDVFSDLFSRGGGPQQGRNFSMRGGDVQYALSVDFVDAAKGAKKRITLPTGQSLDVSIPEGMADGQTLRLKGKGQPGLGNGPTGDALVTISVKPHRVFKRQDANILIDLPISLPEATLGGRVEVPTLSGAVTMTVPKGANSGTVLRLKGKGLKAKGKTGDQLVTLKVVMPEKVDEDLSTFMAEWQTTHAYDPRAEMNKSLKENA